MSYLDLEFNDNLSLANSNDQPQQMDPLAFEQLTPQISGAKLQGLIQSRSGRLRLDLDNDTFIVSDGIVETTRFGKQDDDSYGLVVKNKDGNILMRVTTNENYLQSGDGRSRLDFIANNYTVKDVNNLLRVILGDF